MDELPENTLTKFPAFIRIRKTPEKKTSEEHNTHMNERGKMRMTVQEKINRLKLVWLQSTSMLMEASLI